MATTHRNYTGDGNATKQFTFPSYQESDVKVRVDGVLKTSGTHYNITGYSTTGGGNIVFTSGNIPSSPAVIRIYRDTSVDAAKATFTAGSSVKAADLNNNTTQLLYRAQEEQVPNLIQSYDIGAGAVETSNIKDDSIATAKIPNNAVTTAKIADDAVTVDKLANNSVVAANIQNGQVGTVALADNSVTTAKIVDDTVTTAKIVDSNITTAKLGNNSVSTPKLQDNSVTTAKIPNDAITTAKIADASITTDKLANNSVATAKIPNDAITNAKIGNDQIDSRHYVDGSIDTAHIGSNAITTNKITNNAVTTDKILDDSITTAKIPDNAITTAKIANDAITSAKIVANAVDSSEIKDNAVLTSKITNNAVTTAKIANSNVTIDKIADGNVTTAKLANNAVTTAKITDLNVTTSKIAHDAINSNKLADNAVVTAAIADNAVTTAKIDGSAVTTARIADGAVTTDKLAANAVGTARIADDAITTAKIADDAVNGNKIASDTITNDNVKSNAAIDGSKLANTSITHTQLAANSITTPKIQNDAVTIDKIADAAIVTNSEQASHSVNDTTFFTTAAAEARYFNASTGETIKDGQAFPDNDTTIATTAAINDRIIDLVDDVGGFVPIANETSFPTANPDVNNGSGTLVSVKAISSTRTPSSGTVTIANGAGTGNTVTITGCGSTVLTAGFGVIVETTSTLHTYAFHRLVPKATEVTTVASNITNIVNAGSNTTNINTVAGNSSNITTVAGISGNVTTVAGISSNVTDVANNATNINSVQSNASNINTVAGISGNVTTVANNNSNVTSVANNMANVNNFADKYQIAANNPSTDGGGNALAAGDLYFNTSANELKVYTGSAWQGGVTATGNFASVTGNTFTGDNKYNDGVKALFGTDSDLEIFSLHGSPPTNYFRATSGSNTVIQQQGNGARIRIAATNIHLMNHVQNETYLTSVNNGSVALYYDNNKKFETTAYGISIDNGKAKIEHSGGNTFLQNVTGALFLQGNGVNGTYLRAKSGENSLVAVPDGSVSLYHDNIKRFETNGVGVKVVGDILVGNSSDIEIKNDSGIETLAKFINDGAVELYHDNSKKFETTTKGGKITTTAVNINAEIELDATNGGQSALRLKTSKSGTNRATRIDFHNQDDATNPKWTLLNDFDQDGTNDFRLVDAGQGTGLHLKAVQNGSVELYHDNSKKFETTSDGTLTTGTAQVTKLKVNSVNADINLTSGQNSFTRYGSINHYHNNSTSTPHNQIFFNARNGSTGRIRFFNMIGGTSTERFRIDGTDGVQTYAHLTPATDDNYNLGSSSLRFANVYADHLNITGLSTFSASGSAVRLNDGAIQRYGNADADYFQYYDGSGDIAYLSIGAGRDFRITTDDFNVYGSGNTEQIIRAQKDYGVILYYDNSPKFETTAGGAKLTGTLGQLKFNCLNGTGHEYEFKSSGTNATGFELFDVTRNERAWLYHDDTYLGGVHHFHTDGTLRFAIEQGHVRIKNDNSRLQIGTNNDLQLYHDGTNSRIHNTGTGHLIIRNEVQDSDVILQGNDGGTAKSMLYLDASENGRASFTGEVNIEGTNRIRFYHNTGGGGSFSSFIGQRFTSNSFNLVINNQQNAIFVENDNIVFRGKSGQGDDTLAQFQKSGASSLYYDGTRRFGTTSTGVDIINVAQIGTSNDQGELRIGHDGSTYRARIVSNSSNSLQIDADGPERIQMHGGVIYLKPTNAEKSIAAVANGSAELYYDDSKKAETVSNGFNVFNKLGIGVTVGNSLGNRTYAMAIGDNDTGIAQNGDGILEFWSNNQVKGTIAQGGNGHRVMFNHSDTSTYNAHISSRQNSNGPYPFGAIGQATNQGFMGFFNSGGTLVGNIAKSGNSTQYNTSSDYRLKEDDTVISDGITRLKQLRPIRFKWKEFPEKGHQDGFFAHEVSSVVPEAVNGEKDAVITQEYIDSGKEVQNNLGKPLIQFLDNSKLIPLITAALRDAVAKIETLETKVAALEAA